MFGWKNKLLNSTELKKQNKILNKKHKVTVDRLISKRLFDINNNTGGYIGGKVTISDNPFTEADRKNYGKKLSEQMRNNREQVEVQLPSTAIANARFDEDKGAIYITYVGDGGKEYVFQGDRKTWLKFMNSGSKGRFVQNVMRKYNQAPKSWY